ncbi:hypothetical protein DSL72_003915 [Monilinia vaccinii-corymbosi]|uniref:Uncharacterized protein n=1 Tax=Monilinia vaccinii-corymbosi TaxID=61207 RepID=A0A8A3P3H6_9HELO|nr:hypothetical protein DSL72_003915 [Monilinia vaccinii-corymbosi]
MISSKNAHSDQSSLVQVAFIEWFAEGL